MYPFLSNFSFHVSVKANKASCVLKHFLYTNTYTGKKNFQQKLTSPCALIFQTLLKLLVKHLQVYSFMIVGSYFLKVFLKVSLFNALLKIFVKVAEQLCPLDFRNSDGMLLNVVAFFKKWEVLFIFPCQNYLFYWKKMIQDYLLYY